MFLPPEAAARAEILFMRAAAAAQVVRAPEATRRSSQRVEPKSAVTPSLGVSCKSVTPEFADSANLPVSEGAYVCSVLPGSGAALAGIVTDDAIVAIDDTAVRCARDLVVAVREHSVGDDIVVTLFRGGSEMAVALTLSAKSAEQELAELPELPLFDHQD